MSKHTEGPWHKGIGNGEGSIFGPEGTRRDLGGLYPVASIVFNGPLALMSGEDEANANLISAAPELLDACKRALEIIGCYTIGSADASKKKSVEAIIRAAIAKAEGE